MSQEQGRPGQAAEDGPDVLDLCQRLALHDALSPVGARDHRDSPDVPRGKAVKVRGQGLEFKEGVAQALVGPVRGRTRH
jgi:hypothetical protein